MGTLPKPATARGVPDRTSTTKSLLSALLLSLPFLALLVHCAHREYDNGRLSASFTQDLEPLISAEGPAPAALLFIASHGGYVKTLRLVQGSGTAVSLRVEPVAFTDGCVGNPSWLTIDRFNSVLYCVDQGMAAQSEGSLSSFSIVEDGILARLNTVRTVAGPVSVAVYGKHGKGLAITHHGGSALSTWDIQDPSSIPPIQTRLKMEQPGSGRPREEVPYLRTVTDPTGQFVLVPDVGADIVRIYAVSDHDLNLSERTPFVVAPGGGPRNLAFAKQKKKTFMYIFMDHSNTIVGYEVTYDDNDIFFDEVWASGHGKGGNMRTDDAAAEMVVSPDSNFLILTSRSDATTKIPNLDPDNSTDIASDRLSNFAIDPQTGSLELLQEVPCGGLLPGQISINEAGTLVAVALQNDGRVVVVDRDAETGELGGIVAHADMEEELTAIIFSD
ncbi:Lactonase, 7-bladed beta-propeller-domain-containing protein [Dactylonectria estremocensis]|uniref:Lactonase, 7-bladed beta-propeller-domain-containing protein n=1 Tax=Dactylonectria estremocensis TaxID=1079267 RepID=A0A9P9J4R5_9HYPO|nr:Lactonase, 7-bladed beta-propeller-domain-containing protein [Dactylonectria estremocensis]